MFSANRHMLLMGGGIINRPLSCASAYGDITYINNNITAGNKAINLTLDEAQWQSQLDTDLTI